MEDTAALIIRSQAGDKVAREELIEKNLGLVHHIVRRFQGRGYDSEDLFQIGSIGLMKAIDKFDLSYEVRFSTYAVPMISGEIKRFLRDDGMVKVSRSLKENGWKISRAAEQIACEKGREATLEEIASVTGLEREEIVMAMEANGEVESIDRPFFLSDGNEVSMVDKLPEKRDDNEKLLNHMLLEQLLRELGEEESRLIRLRYYQDQTQVEVARRMGITQVQVSRMEKKILIRLREKIGEY